MKKRLCLFLALVMVISVMPFTVFAGEGAIQQINFTPVKGSKVVYEYTNCERVYNSDGEYDYYYVPPFENGDVLTLVYADSTENYTYDNSSEHGWGAWVGADGEELSGDFDVVTQYTFNQSYDNQYTYGDYEYVIRVTDPYDGEYHTYRQAFTFAPNPVTSFDVDFGHIVLDEGKNCKTAYDENGQPYNVYTFNYYQEGNTITLHTADGDEVYTCRQHENNWGGISMDFIDDDGNELPVEDFYYNDHQAENHWVGGNTYQVDYYYLNHYVTTFDVEIAAAPIAVEVEGFQDRTVLENSNGETRTDDNGEQYFYYYTPGLAQEGVTLSFIYEDETRNKTYHTERRYSDDNTYQVVFVDGDGNTLQDNVYIVDGQETNHWGVGEHTFHYEISGLNTQDFTFTVLEAPKKMTVMGLDGGSAIEGTSCTKKTDSNNVEYNDYWLPAVCQQGVTLTLEYENSPDVVYEATSIYNQEYDYDQWVFVNSETGEQLDGYIHTESDQETNHWGVGEHTYSVVYGNLSQQFTFTVLEAPSEMLIEGLDGGSTIEKQNGYMKTDSNGEQYYYYWLTSVYQEGVIITLRYASGKEEVYHVEQIYNEEEDYYQNRLFDKDGNPCELGFRTVSDQETNHWGVGEHKFSITLGELSQEFTFTVFEEPYDFELNGYEPGSTKAGQNGYMETDEGGEEFFYYWLPNPANEGVTLTLKYRSGKDVVYHTESVYHSDDDYYSWEFFDEDGNELPGWLNVEDDQNENHWGVGEHTYYLTYGNISKEYTFTVKDAPVRFTFEFAQGINTTFMENTNGWFDDESGNFIYNIPWPQEEGNKITVYYSNGDPVVYTCVKEYNQEEDYYEHRFVNGKGEELDAHLRFADQKEHPFSVGDNRLALYMDELETEVVFTVLAGASSITFEPVEGTATFFEHTHGWTAVNDNNVSFYYYNVGNAIYAEGARLTLHFDGQDDVVYVATLVEHEDENGNQWTDIQYINSNNETDVINDWDIHIEENQNEEPWGVGKHEASFVYGNLGCPIEFEIVESDVASIELVLKNGNPTIEENSNGWVERLGDEEDNEFYFYDYKRFLMEDGNQLIVTYKDERGAVVYTVGIDNESEEEGARWLFDANGNRIDDDLEFIDNQWVEHWGVGAHNVTINFRGAETVFTINIVRDDWVLDAVCIDSNGNSYSNGDTIVIPQGEKLFVYFITDMRNAGHGVSPFVGFSDGYPEGTLTQAGFTVITGTAGELGYNNIEQADMFGLEIDPAELPEGTTASLNFYLYEYNDETDDPNNFDFVSTPHAFDGALTVRVAGPVIYDYTITADKTNVDFGAKCVDGADPAAQNVKITNAGDAEFTVLTDEYDFFTLTLVSGSATLQPGESATFSIAPKANLAAGNYTDTIAFKTAFNTNVNVGVSFVVKNHNFGEYVSDGNATYDADGTKTRTCTYCGKKETVTDEGSRLIRNGWFDVQGGKSYFVNGVAVTGMQKIDGNTYFFNANGIMSTGWVTDNGDWYYFNADGTMYKGWKQLKNVWYYFGADGKMATGMKKIGNAAYYFDNNGAMKTGLFKVELSSDYFNWYYANSNGVLQTGWQQINGAWYYFAAPETGYFMMLGGFAEIGGNTYYFDNTGKMVTGWRSVDGAWYYFNASGAMVKGWQQIKNVWYYFNAEGKMVTGMQKIGSATYYFNASGAMLTGWQKIGNAWYYFASSGAMAKGFQTINNVRYYFDADGKMLTGVQEIDGAKYRFESSGAMLKGWQKLNNVWYYFGTDGKMAVGWAKISNVWYYFDAEGKMATGWRQVNGAWYFFESSGKMHTGWLSSGGKWYYMESSGKMLANTSKKIGNKTYNFNASGVCTNP